MAAWTDSDFATSIRVPADPDLADLTRTLNALGGQLRDERQRLIQRELLLDTVVQNTPTALILTDPRERVIYGNLAARELFGVPGKLEGHAFAELVARLPEALQAKVAVYERVNDALDASQLKVAVQALADRLTIALRKPY